MAMKSVLPKNSFGVAPPEAFAKLTREQLHNVSIEALKTAILKSEAKFDESVKVLVDGAIYWREQQ
jgi:hypothetical protein